MLAVSAQLFSVPPPRTFDGVPGSKGKFARSGLSALRIPALFDAERTRISQRVVANYHVFQIRAVFKAQVSLRRFPPIL